MCERFHCYIRVFSILILEGILFRFFNHKLGIEITPDFDEVVRVVPNLDKTE